MDAHLQVLGMKAEEKYTAADILKAYRLMLDLGTSNFTFLNCSSENTAMLIVINYFL